MLGFSLPKILVLAALVAAAWYFFKFIERRNKMAKKVKDDPADGTAKPVDAMDMLACSVCGDYVAAGAASCGRSDCPYPGG